MEEEKRIKMFETQEEYVNYRLEGKTFLQAIPLIDEYGQTWAIGVFYNDPLENRGQTRYMELGNSDRYNPPYLVFANTQDTSEKEEEK